MRCVFALAGLLGAAALAPSQEKPKTADDVRPRFGLAFRPKAYAQATPKQALESAITAADKGEFNYLVAHLLDPAFVDARVGVRARQFEPAIEADLARLREFQQQNLDKVSREDRVPVDPTAFRERVAGEARVAAFRQIVRDVQEKLTDDPEVLKDLRRFNRQGTFPDPGAAGETAKVGLPDVKDRAVYLKKIGERWYVENRQTDEKTPEPKKE
ncbi:MAG: hypothetical protein JWO38_2649 [Gemmataceae bacterium]|nr:hypothetical protein [Gemmataceae bacterium]